MVNIWFSSDLHLSHENIIKFCGRPFTDVHQMNDALRTYHNMFVKPEDHWYCLGDVTLERGSKGSQQAKDFIAEMKRWHGHKRLILGNHDHFPTEVYLEAGFEKIYGTWRGIENLLLSHFPLHPKSLYGVEANVHGHIHNNEGIYEPLVFVDRRTQRVKYVPYINLSVEVTNYRPFHLDDVKAMIGKAKGEWEGVKVEEEVMQSLPKEEDNA